MISSNGSVAICPRTETGATKYLDGSGYLHVIDKSAPIPAKRDEAGEELPEHNLVLSSIASKMLDACTDDRADALGNSLGVSRLSLRLLRVGWSNTSDAFSFPMWRAGHRIIGIRLRSMSGKKWAIKGSRQGLFMPIEWINKKNGVIICEGPTDTAAMTTLGFNAIGRPSAMGSHALVEEAVSGKSVCIISDSDKVGIDSSTRLARHLIKTESCKRVGILIPPHKDAREWVRCGATRSEVADAISESMRCDGPFHCR
jgi:5S rRNA maturation endonuclease (ribonuclease M5)